jgi:hypothetical protein
MVRALEEVVYSPVLEVLWGIPMVQPLQVGVRVVVVVLMLGQAFMGRVLFKLKLLEVVVVLQVTMVVVHKPLKTAAVEVEVAGEQEVVLVDMHPVLVEKL